MRLKDKVAIVTGAGRGIGKAIALAYAHEGANIVTISRTLSEIEKTSEQIRANGRRAIAIGTDVSNAGEVEDAVSLVVERSTIEGYLTREVFLLVLDDLIAVGEGLQLSREQAGLVGESVSFRH